MAFYPKQRGTTEQQFDIGAGNGKTPITLDTLVTDTLSIAQNAIETTVAITGVKLTTYDITTNQGFMIQGRNVNQTTDPGNWPDPIFVQAGNETSEGPGGGQLSISGGTLIGGIGYGGGVTFHGGQGLSIPVLGDASAGGNVAFTSGSGDLSGDIAFSTDHGLSKSGDIGFQTGLSETLSGDIYFQTSVAPTTGKIYFSAGTNTLSYLPSGEIKLNGNAGTSGQVLKSQGPGAAAVWGDAGSSTPYVPLTIGTLDTFTVPTNTQLLYATDIDVVGDLVVDGDLIDVNPATTAVAAQVPKKIAYGTKFTVGHNKQVPFNEVITVIGDLEVFGDLIDDVLNPTGVTPGTYTSATITVDVYGRIGYAASGSIAAAGSTYDIQRNSYGNFYGDSNLVYDTSSSTHWFKVAGGANFLATFGANNSSPYYNSTAALFIQNDLGSGTYVRTSDNTNNGVNSSLSILTGSGSQSYGYPTGGNVLINAGNGTSTYGYTYSASGGRFEMNAGAGDTQNSTNNTLFANGGQFLQRAGDGRCNTSQLGASGGSVALSAGYAVKGSTYVGGAGFSCSGGSINGSTYAPGDTTLSAGTSPTGRGVINLYSGQVVLGVIGQGISIAEGANAKQGIATLVAGTVTLSNTSVTANSRIFLTIQDPNGGTPGYVWISTRTPGTDFTIQSSSILDTSIVAYEIFEPS